MQGVKSRFETTWTLGAQGQAAGVVGVRPLALQRWQCFIRSTESHLVDDDRKPVHPIGAGRIVSVQKVIVNNFNLGRPFRGVRLAICRIRRYFAPVVAFTVSEGVSSRRCGVETCVQPETTANGPPAPFEGDTADGMQTSTFRRRAECFEKASPGDSYIWRCFNLLPHSHVDAVGRQPLIGVCPCNTGS